MALATWKEYSEAFGIFAKYHSKGSDHVMGEHDEIWAGPSPTVVSDEDKERLKKLGWTSHEDNDCWHKYT